MENKKALVGMSGGVDSSVAAYLMLRQGYECTGVTMRLYDSPTEDSTCCSLDDVEDARAVAAKLGIRHYTFNFKDDFDRRVVQKFVSSYERGLTPNPCIDCNRYLEFDRLGRRAQELGWHWVVSGHCARIRRENGRYILYKAADRTKDQTYFLACLNQEQLSHIQFPLGDLTKVQVREIAEANGFVNARKRDSQDICFVPDGDYGAFLQRYTKLWAATGVQPATQRDSAKGLALPWESRYTSAPRICRITPSPSAPTRRFSPLPCGPTTGTGSPLMN